MNRCTTSAVGFLVALGMIATVSAQQPAQGGRGGGQGAAAVPPATLVMNVTFQPAVPGKTEQLPFVQANVANADIELKQYGSGNQVLTNAGNPRQFLYAIQMLAEESAPKGAEGNAVPAPPRVKAGKKMKR